MKATAVHTGFAVAVAALNLLLACCSLDSPFSLIDQRPQTSEKLSPYKRVFRGLQLLNGCFDLSLQQRVETRRHGRFRTPAPWVGSLAVAEGLLRTAAPSVFQASDPHFAFRVGARGEPICALFGGVGSRES